MHFSVAFAVTALALLPGTLGDDLGHPGKEYAATPYNPPSHKEPEHKAPEHKAPEHKAPEHKKPEYKEPEHKKPEHEEPKKPAPKPKPTPEHHDEHKKPAPHHKPAHYAPTRKLTKPTRYYPEPTAVYGNNLSKDGSCGGYSGYNCLGSGFGNCCGFVRGQICSTSC